MQNSTSSSVTVGAETLENRPFICFELNSGTAPGIVIRIRISGSEVSIF
jgi:hypothetical protein